MKRIENNLFEAAKKGCIFSLQQLLKEDPLILDRVSCFNETPLHVAAMLGHVDFVKKIIEIKPQLVNELNLHKSSPLHLASAKGHVEIVRALLSVDQRMCLARDRNALTPLHLASIKGRVEVVKVLLQANHEAARLTGCLGESIMHLCVKHDQLEALKVLVRRVGDREFVNFKDGDGNTALHLAVEDKQVEMISFLLTIPALEVNARNVSGMTTSDVLIRSRRDVRDSEIEESLKNARGVGAALETNTSLEMNHIKKKLFNNQDDWLDKKKNSLMVVASLLATMAFQAGVNPPDGIWQDDNLLDAPGAPRPDHYLGFFVLAYNFPTMYTRFYIVNASSFVASLSIILLLMSGLPLRRRFFMWFLMVITWIAITATALTYVIAILVLTPTYLERLNVLVIGFSVVVWIILMAILFLGHTIRLIVKLAKWLRKRSWRRKRMRTIGDDLMERMEMELFDAAAKGCIISLQNLLKDDPLILDRVGVSCLNETPLHVAASAKGHVEVASTRCCSPT